MNNATLRRLLRFHFRSLSTESLRTPQNSQHDCGLLQYNKRIRRFTKLGQVEAARQLFDSMPRRDSVSFNSMLTCYIQNNQLNEAKSLFDSFQDKNVVTWTILLSGYAKCGLMNEARILFDSMPERNVVSWNSLVSGYVHNGDIRSAREVFDKMPERNVSSWNSILTGYCRCGMVKEAREIFDRMNERNSVSWIVMISGYFEVNQHRESWYVFLLMLKSGMMPDQAIFVVGVSAIMGLNDLDLLGSLRTMVIKLGYEGDVVVGTAILNAYMRNGSLDEAYKFFQGMPKRNEYSCTSMIASFAQCGRLDDAIALYESGDCIKGVGSKSTILAAYAQRGNLCEARRVFDEIRCPNVVAWNAMVAGYAQNGMLEEAKAMFLRMPIRNAVSWATMISGFVQNEKFKEALELFAELHRTGEAPSHSGFTSALSACATLGDVELGRQIHTLTIKTRCQHNPYVGNGLISMYAKSKNMGDVSQAFSTMQVRDIVSWNSLIAGFSENNMLDDALDTFQKMPKRDEVSWTTVISAYVQAGQFENALKMFLQMLRTGMKPRDFALISLLSACSSMGTTKLGKQIHALILKNGFNSCLCVCNALITMYFKCGSLDSFSVFEDMPVQDIISWNAVLTGCAQIGLGEKAISIFEQMKAAGIFPDEISFLGVIGACCNAGSVDKAQAYFNCMRQIYGISPMTHKYSCMVDLLGKAGELYEAQTLTDSMPVESD